MSISFRPEASRSVVVLDGVDRVAFNEDGSLELLTPAANPTGNKVMTASQMPFAKEYISPEQTITASGLLTLVHGLGAVPKTVTGWLVCKTAESGYTVGDTVFVSLMNVSSSAGDNFGAQCKVNATNVFIRLGASPFLIGRWSDGLSIQTVSANWRLVVRAWA